MGTDIFVGTDTDQIRQLLQRWATATRTNLLDEVLEHHLPSALIYDVLPPLRYQGVEVYRRSWDDWQPDTQGDAIFDLQDLTIVAGTEVAFASGVIQCGGTLPSGRVFEDLVRATFCLQKFNGHWKVVHQHISKPFSV